MAELRWPDYDSRTPLPPPVSRKDFIVMSPWCTAEKHRDAASPALDGNCIHSLAGASGHILEVDTLGLGLKWPGTSFEVP